MQRNGGKSDIKVGDGAGGEKRGEVISGDPVNRTRRGGGTIRDHIRVNTGSRNRGNDPPHTEATQQESLCPGKDIKKTL